MDPSPFNKSELAFSLGAPRMNDLSDQPLAPMLRKLNFLGNFGPEDVRALLALPHTLKTIEAHAYIVREGDRATHSCLLRTGFAYRQKIVVSGLRQICSIHLAGDLVDLQNSLLIHADHSVQALNRIKVAFIPREAILEIAYARPEIGKAMWFDTLVDASIFREWTTNLGRRGARARIAHILCEFGARLDAAGLGERCDYQLPMSQEQLGDCTGLTSVHVNRMLRSLEEEGLISRSSRAVRIADWKALARAGEFDDAYLHLTLKSQPR
ncbi:MAG: Crp/Fnr family transcriptional regulator [Pseudomonadota bacterium]|nr:Crp/Fnr family transcriptional regulator [Pseudomonadota bacterium]